MTETNLVAFTAAAVGSFFWTQLMRTSSPATRTIGVVVIMGAFIAFALVVD